MRYRGKSCSIDLLGDSLKITLIGESKITTVPVTEILRLLRLAGYTYDDIPCPNEMTSTSCGCQRCRSKCDAV